MPFLGTFHLHVTISMVSVQKVPFKFYLTHVFLFIFFSELFFFFFFFNSGTVAALALLLLMETTELFKPLKCLYMWHTMAVTFCLHSDFHFYQWWDQCYSGSGCKTLTYFTVFSLYIFNRISDAPRRKG